MNGILNEIQTSLKAPKSQENKFGGYRYRSCEDILEALKPLLKKTGATLVIADEIVEVAGRVYVKATATLKSKDGEVSATAFAREPENKKGMDEAQITGATSSYARKYALNGLFAIDDTKDADATNDHGRGAKVQMPSQARKDAIKTAVAKAKTLKELNEIDASTAEERKTWPKTWQDGLNGMIDARIRELTKTASGGQK